MITNGQIQLGKTPVFREFFLEIDDTAAPLCPPILQKI